MQIFEISPGLFIWSLLTFLVLMFLLWKFAYGPLMEMQQKRQDEIHDSIVEAERLRDEAHTLLEDYKQQVAGARVEAEEILERARKVGESARAEIITEAKTQSDRMLDKAHEQIERDTKQALQEINQVVADLTVAATEKVTGKTLTEEDQLRLIAQAIDDIDLSKVSEN